MKNQVKNNEFPFIKDNNHIFNILAGEPHLSQIDFGWCCFSLELAHNLMYEGSKCDGLTEFDQKSIKIEIDLDDSTARETIMHEILHVILETIGLTEKNFDGDKVVTTNEFLAHSIAKQLMLIRNLNPGLLDLIYECRI